MKLHIVTIGKPKLAYAQSGWNEYLHRLQHFHAIRITHLADKHADDDTKINEVTRGSYVVVLEITGTDLSSAALAEFITARELEAREVCFVIGGPNGLAESIRSSANFRWSLSRLTLPHDLAMVVTLEALYRASTINARLPYHR